jgi:pimeloyl-ACP methyl ester carboxylesterase
VGVEDWSHPSFNLAADEVVADHHHEGHATESKSRVTTMATFVLVQGAWVGSWYWKRVRSRLQVQGHQVFTPTLTGLADRSHLLTSDVNLETHIADVMNLIRWEELSDVVLCGHSYGGCVISGVADRLPNHIRSLVYLDAFVLQDGENLAQHVPAPQYGQLMEGAKSIGDGWKVPPIPPEVFNVDAADAEWMKRQYTMPPLGCFEQRITLTGGIEQIKDVTFVLAMGFTDGSPFPPFYEMAKAKGWKTRTMSCGHIVMLDQPDQVARILVEAAEAQPA